MSSRSSASARTPTEPTETGTGTRDATTAAKRRSTRTNALVQLDPGQDRCPGRAGLDGLVGLRIDKYRGRQTIALRGHDAATGEERRAGQTHRHRRGKTGC